MSEAGDCATRQWLVGLRLSALGYQLPLQLPKGDGRVRGGVELKRCDETYPRQTRPVPAAGRDRQHRATFIASTVVGFAQFPLYGYMLGDAASSGMMKFTKVAFWIALCHGIAVAVFLAVFRLVTAP